MNIGIVGFAREGKTAFDYWNKDGNTFVIYDLNATVPVPPGTVPRLGEHYKDYLLEDMGTLNLIVKTPGISLLDIENKITTPITSITKEFFDQCPGMIIGVTGTKGKGTTASLVYEILKNARKDVYLVGNIGVPALTVLPELTRDSIVIYELSSFQLYDLHKSPHIAVCLPVSEDHLDWHRTTEHYQNAKSSIFKYQTPDDVAIWNSDNVVAADMAALSPATQKISYGKHGDARVQDGALYYHDQKICDVSHVLIPGNHNLENACAAIAATYGLVSTEHIVQALSTFTGLPYHIENRGIKRGVTFVNDSFSTNPASTIVAVDAFPEPLVLMVGGLDRGLDLHDIAEKLSGATTIKHIVLYGAFGKRLHQELALRGVTASEYVEGSFENIFNQAVSLSVPGDTLLFSPGAPSFDMFENYIKRGEVFNVLVGKLSS